MGVQTRNHLIMASLLLTFVVTACRGGAEVAVHMFPTATPLPVFIPAAASTDAADIISSRPAASRVAVATAISSPNPGEIAEQGGRPNPAPIFFGAPESPPVTATNPSVKSARTPEPPTHDELPLPAFDGGSQVCQDYLFAGRPAPDVSPGFYVERIVCLTPDGFLEPVYHPTDLPGLQALVEALRMELLATQRLSDARLAELNRMAIAHEGEAIFFPAVYVEEQIP